jgi:N6-L-threonylcarbamoyladenine synthase
MYIDEAREKFEKIKNKEDKVILAVESSCDETAVAITKGKEVLANIIASQIDIHKRYGGVVPEIASRNHIMAIQNCVDEALGEANMKLDDIDLFAVTYGAGLLGALLVGVSYVKALAFATKKPLIAVNHIKGHIAVNYIANKDLKPPYICLIASGGHTAIAKVSDYDDIEILGQTQDDACGEAFDKVARVLGLPYPGGPQIQEIAKGGKASIEMPIPYKDVDTLDFSFSGIKTAVINYAHKMELKGEEINKKDLAYSFQDRVTSIMVNNTILCARKYHIGTVVIAGGVGSNEMLRDKMSKAAKKNNLFVYYPPVKLCTDNAVMIASEAYHSILAGAEPVDIDLDADANLKITD